MTEPPIRWHVYPNPDRLVDAVVDNIAGESAAAISAAGRFLIVLAGGATPRPIYAALVELDTNWGRWHIYFSDERCLPVGHRQRNDAMARKVWLDHVSIPAAQIHAIPAELNPDAVVKIYARTLAEVGMFDLAILGLGEDGHTASLFPGHPLGAEPGAPDILAVKGAPKPPASRISLSAARLARSHAVCLIVTGKAKREILTRLQNGQDLPIRSVIPKTGIDLFLDRSAAPSNID